MEKEKEMKEKKEFFNYEKQLELLINRILKPQLDISSEKELLMVLYRRHFKHTTEQSPLDWYEKVKPNFSKWKSGDGRTFPPDWIVAIEEVAGMSLYEIQQLTDGDTPDKPKLRPHGIRYAAYADDVKEYEALCDEYDLEEQRPVILNCDEYGKNIVHYTVEYNSLAGLRYLIEHNIIEYLGYREISNKIYNTEQALTGVWELLCRIDDAELFAKIISRFIEEIRKRDADSINTTHFLPYAGTETDKKENEAMLCALMGTRNIFESLLVPIEWTDDRGDDERSSRCMHPLLRELLFYSLEEDISDIYERILEVYERFIGEEIKRTRELLKDRYERRFVISSNENVIRDLKSNTPLIYFWDFSYHCTYPEHLKSRLDAISWENITNSLEDKDLSTMKDGERRTDSENGILYLKCEETEGIEILKYMTSRGAFCLPEYLGEEQGAHKIEFVYHPAYEYRQTDPRRRREYPNVELIFRLFGEFHSLAQERLGEGSVYAYGSGIGNAIFRRSYDVTRRGSVYVLAEWDRLRVGSAIEELTELLLEFTDIADIGTRNNDLLLYRIKNYIAEYGNSALTKRLGDSLLTEFERRLSRVSGNEFEKIHYAIGFVLMYRDSLNEIGDSVC